MSSGFAYQSLAPDSYASFQKFPTGIQGDCLSRLRVNHHTMNAVTKCTGEDR